MPKILTRFLDKLKTNVGYSITIDKEVAKALNLEKGDTFYWIINEKRKGKRELTLREL